MVRVVVPGAVEFLIAGLVQKIRESARWGFRPSQRSDGCVGAGRPFRGAGAAGGGIDGFGNDDRDDIVDTVCAQISWRGRQGATMATRWRPAPRAPRREAAGSALQVLDPAGRVQAASFCFFGSGAAPRQAANNISATEITAAQYLIIFAPP